MENRLGNEKSHLDGNKTPSDQNTLLALYRPFIQDSAVDDRLWAEPGANVEWRRHPSAQLQGHGCNLTIHRPRFETATPCTGRICRLRGTKLLSSLQGVAPGSLGEFVLRNAASFAVPFLSFTGNQPPRAMNSDNRAHTFTLLRQCTFALVPRPRKATFLGAIGIDPREQSAQGHVLVGLMRGLFPAARACRLCLACLQADREMSQFADETLRV